MTKQEFFKKHGHDSEDKACSDSLDWIASLPKTYNAKQIWGACKRPDWMLWYLKRNVDKNDPRFRLAACAFVRRTPIGGGKFVWDLLSDDRSKLVVEVSELHAAGLATDADLNFAYAAAAKAEADAAADAADAAYAAYAAAYAAYTAAYAAARAASDAAYAASDAAYAANAAHGAADAAYAAAYAAQCNIIREFFPEPE